MTTPSEWHDFENGVRVLPSHLTKEQLARYRERNVHEAVEEEIFCREIAALHSGDVFLNIGAAVGYYPILCKKMAPHVRVIALEPLQEFRNAALANFALNGLGPLEIELHAVAIGGASGTLDFLDMGFGSAGLHSGQVSPGKRLRALALRPLRSLIRSFGWAGRQRLHKVDLLTLDRFLEQYDQPIGLCQMDVQGMEREVLEGAVSSLSAARIHTFLIGTHGITLHKECKSLLQDAGYAIECDEPDPMGQPDGILLARCNRTTRRLPLTS